MQLAATEFKNKCLHLIDVVNQTHKEIVITKHGQPMARLVPAKKRQGKEKMFGRMAGTVTFLGDVIKPVWE